MRVSFCKKNVIAVRKINRVYLFLNAREQKMV